MKIGRQDHLVEALDVEGWLFICSRVGEGIESFSGRGFERSTGLFNHDYIITPERLPEFLGSKNECCGCTACALACPLKG